MKHRLSHVRMSLSICRGNREYEVAHMSIEQMYGVHHCNDFHTYYY
jgi:hypothetical protein